MTRIKSIEVNQTTGERTEIFFTAAEEAEADAHEAAYFAEEPARQAAALIDSITNATQQRLDDFAKTRGYDGILSACTYASSPTAKFASEGQYCVNKRDETWAVLYTIMAEVEAGARPMPTGYEGIEGELPALVWPA